MAKGSKYTAEMEARIREAGENGTLNLETANRLANETMFAEAGITARGIVAKIRSMGLEYEKVARKDKAGRTVARKDELVERVEAVTGLTFSNLEKAGREDLRALVDYLEGVDA